MAKEEYYNQKSKRSYQLFLEGKPSRKVYAVVEKDGKYVVLHYKNGVYEYALSGGGVDEGEDNITAIHREIMEELNMNVEIVKSLGVIKYVQKRQYQGKEFDLNYIAEIFLTKFVSYGDNKNFGIDGEFDENVSIVEISKEKMLTTVAEFVKFGLKLN